MVRLNMGSEGRGPDILAQITKKSWDDNELRDGETVHAQIKGVALTGETPQGVETTPSRQPLARTLAQVSQPDDAIEDGRVFRAIGIGAEITQAFELKRLGRRPSLQARLQLATREHLEAFGIDVIQIVAVRAGVFLGEQVVVKPHFRIQGAFGGNPRKRALDLAAIRRDAALGFRVVRATKLDDLARVVPNDFPAGDEVGPTQPHLATDGETETFSARPP